MSTLPPPPPKLLEDRPLPPRKPRAPAVPPDQRKRAFRTRWRLTEAQRDYLETVFQQSNHPSNTNIKKLAQILQVDVARVRGWFQNRRQRLRKLRLGGHISSGSEEDDATTAEDCSEVHLAPVAPTGTTALAPGDAALLAERPEDVILPEDELFILCDAPGESMPSSQDDESSKAEPARTHLGGELQSPLQEHAVLRSPEPLLADYLLPPAAAAALDPATFVATMSTPLGARLDLNHIAACAPTATGLTFPPAIATAATFGTAFNPYNPVLQPSVSMAVLRQLEHVVRAMQGPAMPLHASSDSSADALPLPPPATVHPPAPTEAKCKPPAAGKERDAPVAAPLLASSHGYDVDTILEKAPREWLEEEMSVDDLLAIRLL